MDMNYKNKINLTIHKAFILFALTLLIFDYTSCSKRDNYEKRVIPIVRKEWKSLLERVRNGTGYVSHTKGLYSTGILRDLYVYLEKNKKRIYRGDENQWFYDQAMIKLMDSEFIDSFKLFKEYMDKTGDNIKPWLHTGLIIGKNDIMLESYYIINVIDNVAVNDKHILNVEEEIYLLDNRGSHFFAVMPKEKLSRQVMSSELYKKYDKSYVNFEEDQKDFLSEELINKYYDLDFPQQFIENLSMNNPNDEEIDLIYRYYLKSKKYENAYAVANKYGFGKWLKLGPFKLQDFLPSILEVIYYLGKYDEVIEVYEEYKDNEFLIAMERTYCSGYYWVASAYAQKGEYDKALSFLKLAFDNTSIQSMREWVDDLKMNTFSLIWHVILSDGFDKFKDVGRYEEVERLMEQGLAKYKHLDWFATRY